MLGLTMNFRRRWPRFVVPPLLVAAVGSYGAQLWSAHAAATFAPPSVVYAQRFGMTATARKNAVREPTQGDVVVGSEKFDRATAQWSFGPFVRANARETAPPTGQLFIVGSNFAFYRPSSYAIVSVNGVAIGTLRPEAPRPEAPRGPFAVEDPPIADLAIPPNDDAGFHFDLPRDGTCVTSVCSVRITVARGTWVVDRLGVLYSSPEPLAPALWPSKDLGWKIGLIAAGVAALSHLAVSFRFGRARTAPVPTWKAS